MKSVIKHHSGSVKTIAPYIASSIVSIFVKNPKTLSVGYKVSTPIKQYNSIIDLVHSLLFAFVYFNTLFVIDAVCVFVFLQFYFLSSTVQNQH